MGLKSYIAKRWASRRVKAINRESADPVNSQARTLRLLLQTAAQTEFGKSHRFSGLRDEAQFRSQVPVRDYEAAKPFFEKIMKGGKDISWPGQPLYLAKTSGTTSGAKYIPITRESIRYQVMGAKDTLLTHIHRTGDASFLNGKMLFLSGSPALEINEAGMKVGRLSGIVNHFVPRYLQGNQIPSMATNCIEDWETKVERILDEAIGKDLRVISGIPPWVQQFFERLQVRTGQTPMEQWPNLSLFLQGGVNYSPYEPIFRPLLGNKVKVIEVFPASEGFFAFQDGESGQGLRLNFGTGIYYEFIPLNEYGDAKARRLGIGEVKLNEPYALVVTTNAGLWAYDIGDTVRFVSLDPPRMVVTGRVKHFISAFGEHVIGEELEAALKSACEATGAVVNEFTVAPLIEQTQGQSCHEWWIEFAKEPEDVGEFARRLDEAVANRNVYYRDLRQGGTLRSATVRRLSANASREYMKSIGKLGGQNKFPRLKNNREVADGLAPFELK